jgi:hypothetical protein
MSQMNHRTAHLRRLVAPMVLALACLAALPAAVPAQDARPKAPVPSKTGQPPKVMNMITLVVILGIGLGVQAIPSKRGHQD